MKRQAASSIASFVAALLLLSGCARSLSQQLTLPHPSPPDREEINSDAPGKQCDIGSALVYGKYTIVEFYSPFCGPCMEIKPLVEQLAVARRDIAVRSVNINRPEVQGIDWNSPVAEQYQLHYVPYFKIYGPDAKLMSEGKAAKQDVISCLEANQ